MIKIFSGDFEFAHEADAFLNDAISSGFKYLVRSLSKSPMIQAYSRSDTTPGKGVIRKDGVRVLGVALSDDPRCGELVDEFAVFKSAEYEEYTHEIDGVWVNYIHNDFVSKLNDGWRTVTDSASPITYHPQVLTWSWEYNYYYTRSSSTYGICFLARFANHDSTKKSGWALVKYEEVEAPQ